MQKVSYREHKWRSSHSVKHRCGPTCRSRKPVGISGWGCLKPNSTLATRKRRLKCSFFRTRDICPATDSKRSKKAKLCNEQVLVPHWKQLGNWPVCCKPGASCLPALADKPLLAACVHTQEKEVCKTQAGVSISKLCKTCQTVIGSVTSLLPAHILPQAQQQSLMYLPYSVTRSWGQRTLCLWLKLHPKALYYVSKTSKMRESEVSVLGLSFIQL